MKKKTKKSSSSKTQKDKPKKLDAPDIRNPEEMRWLLFTLYALVDFDNVLGTAIDGGKHKTIINKYRKLRIAAEAFVTECLSEEMVIHTLGALGKIMNNSIRDAGEGTVEHRFRASYEALRLGVQVAKMNLESEGKNAGENVLEIAKLVETKGALANLMRDFAKCPQSIRPKTPFTPIEWDGEVDEENEWVKKECELLEKEREREEAATDGERKSGKGGPVSAADKRMEVLFDIKPKKAAYTRRMAGEVGCRLFDMVVSGALKVQNADAVWDVLEKIVPPKTEKPPEKIALNPSKMGELERSSWKKAVERLRNGIPKEIVIKYFRYPE